MGFGIMIASLELPRYRKYSLYVIANIAYTYVIGTYELCPCRASIVAARAVRDSGAIRTDSVSLSALSRFGTALTSRFTSVVPQVLLHDPPLKRRLQGTHRPPSAVPLVVAPYVRERRDRSQQPQAHRARSASSLVIMQDVRADLLLFGRLACPEVQAPRACVWHPWPFGSTRRHQGSSATCNKRQVRHRAQRELLDRREPTAPRRPSAPHRPDPPR